MEFVSPSSLQKASYPSWVSVSHLPAKAILVVLVGGGVRAEMLRQAEGRAKVLRLSRFPVYILCTSRHLPHLHVMTQESNYTWRWWVQGERALTCINGRLWSSPAVSKVLTLPQGALVAHLQVNEPSRSGFMVAPSTFTAAGSGIK